MIEIRNVDKKYGKIYALKNISFNIKEEKITSGEIVVPNK